MWSPHGAGAGERNEEVQRDRVARAERREAPAAHRQDDRNGQHAGQTKHLEDRSVSKARLMEGQEVFQPELLTVRQFLRPLYHGLE